MWLFKLIGGFIAGPFMPIVRAGFDWLNKRIDERVQIRQSDNTTAQVIHGQQVQVQMNADNLNTQVRLKEGPWSPWVIATIGGFMAPFGWHTWQVVLDSSRWHPAIDFALGFIPYPTVTAHVVGSWKVAALPGLFETTEHAVIQSLFVGAGVAVGGIALIKAARGK
jgi:hypothetical protein